MNKEWDKIDRLVACAIVEYDKTQACARGLCAADLARLRGRVQAYMRENVTQRAHARVLVKCLAFK